MSALILLVVSIKWRSESDMRRGALRVCIACHPVYSTRAGSQSATSMSLDLRAVPACLLQRVANSVFRLLQMQMRQHLLNSHTTHAIA